MHVLRVAGPRERAGPELIGDRLETGDERGRVLCRKDLLPAEHPRVGDASAHVVERDALVELERRGERADLRVEPPCEPPLPEIAHFLLSFPALLPRVAPA